MALDSWTLAYSALLHDVGKLVQRSVKNPILEHQEAGVKFLKEIPLPPQLEKHRTHVENLVGGHHYPQKYCLKPNEELTGLLNILKEADRLSAKERQPLEEKEIADSIFSTPLCSIFYSVRLEGKNSGKPAEKFYHNVMQFNCGELMLPDNREKLPADLTDNYAKLLKEFEREAKALSKIEDLEAHFTTLYYLLMKYTFFVPSVTVKSEPDISLFEHLSTTCAIAESLYNGEKDEILLISGDFCRIQSFVYTITSEQAAKMLRGRAFYVYLLNKTIALYILRRLNLPISNMIFCGGGIFTILAPCTDEKMKLLNDCVREVNEWLLKKFNGELYVAVAPLKINIKDLENFDKLLMIIGQKLEEVKLRQFIDLLPKRYESVFGCNSETVGESGEAGTCQVCKKVLVEHEKERTDGVTVCKTCKSFENLGSNLVKSDYLVMLIYDPSQPPAYELDANFERFGFGYKFVSDKSRLKSILEELLKLPSIKLVNVIRLNSTEDFICEDLLQSSSAPIAFSFDFISRHVPLNEQKAVESFDNIVKNSQGAEFLGVLRMDVDDLGEIFFKGLGGGASISRISTMSRLLSTFFDGFIDWLVKNNYNRKVYIVYSGGDDLLLMGRWDSICNLSVEIQKAFTTMTSKNPNVTISAGVILANPKWPVYRLAQTSKHFLDHSKNKKWKNSITIFGDKPDYTVSWIEFEKLKNLKEELYKRVHNNILSKNFLSHMRRVHRIYETETKRNGQRYKWLLRYLIARQIRQYHELTKEFLWLESEIENCIRNLDIPVIWVDLLTRKGRQSSK